MNEKTRARSQLAAALAARTPKLEAGATHPSTDDLLAYHRDELAAPAAAEIADHLDACSACIESLLDLALLATPEEAGVSGENADDGETTVSEFDRATAWRTLRRQLKPTQTPGQSVQPGWPKILLSLAAGLAMAVLGLGIWVAQLRQTAGQQAAQLRSGEINFPVAYLDPVSRGAGSQIVQLELASENKLLLLMVTPPHPQPAASYALELFNSADQTVWRGVGLRASQFGSLRAALSTHLFQTGDYRVVLTQQGEESTPTTVAEYRLRLRFP